ncbi:MAG TPA: pilus assembly protein TadG-related protein [Allosphingosinicella sp.]|jgi:Flp pilus assembly protein TadG|nr:pilus assembly protein TadG-related protein [Allosphingosinicella sp.]
MDSMQPLKWLKRLARNESGNALVVCAATLPLVIGAAAIGVDTIQVSLARRQLQRAADSAAIAGAYAVLQSQSAATSVTHDLALNNDVTLSGSPVIENAPTAGPLAGNNRAVRVVLTAQRSVPFISFFMGSTMTVRVEATAAAVFSGQYCMVALENTNVTAISFSGSTFVNLGCGVVSNSTAATAVTAGGSSAIVASPVAAVGGVPSSSSYANGTTLLPYSPPTPDPYASIPDPTVPSGCNNSKLNVQPGAGKDVTITAADAVPGMPGVFCWRGADIGGTISFPANSTVIIDGGKLDFGAQADVRASGITFVLTSRTAATDPTSIAQVEMHGNAVLNITAPDSGTYKGLLMYQDRRTVYGSSTINGNSATTYRGGFYFPNRQLLFNGNTGMHTECLQLVARRLVFSGNSTVQNTCPTNGGAQAFDANFVRLVG